ncbi:hypothetical protein [Pareuzebyella sediminis]|uniref:hypothetical protein n=1 Tax=Pareuzebyella sediminis TaxID=2607998 RepID=UPI0011EBDB21|nr:hypothetical protein [Pareuzebyella sediminis]
MENRTEFSIDKSINNWKHQLSKTANFTEDNINELESHLLDEIQELNKIGLNEEESFLVASKRIGTIEQLTFEYSKVNRKVYFRNRIFPFLTGILVFIAYMAITDLATYTSIFIADKLKLDSDALNWLSIGILLLLSLISLVIFYNKYKNGKYNLRVTKNIPFLVITVIITKSLSIFSLSYFTHLIGHENFGIVRFNLGVFQLSILILILIVSTVIFYSSKRDKKLKFAE